MPCQPAQTLRWLKMATLCQLCIRPNPLAKRDFPWNHSNVHHPTINQVETRLGGGQDSPRCPCPDMPRLEDTWGVPGIPVAYQRADSLHARPQPGGAGVKLLASFSFVSKKPSKKEKRRSRKVLHQSLTKATKLDPNSRQRPINPELSLNCL